MCTRTDSAIPWRLLMVVVTLAAGVSIFVLSTTDDAAPRPLPRSSTSASNP